MKDNMKRYISPEMQVIDVQNETAIMAYSNIGIDHDDPRDDFNASSRRGSGWDDYEK